MEEQLNLTGISKHFNNKSQSSVECDTIMVYKGKMMHTRQNMLSLTT